jgi:hypothetical protein
LLCTRSASKAQQYCIEDGWNPSMSGKDSNANARSTNEDRGSNGEQNRIERRKPMNQDQEWRSCSESPKSKKPGQRRTQKNDPQDVGKRRELNRRPMTNFTTKRSRDSNSNSSRNHLTNGTIRNQNGSARASECDGATNNWRESTGIVNAEK